VEPSRQGNSDSVSAPHHLPTSVTRRSYRESSPFPPLTVIYPPPVSAAVPLSLKASSHGVNDGWRKRKETTHGESERETDERLDQDMRKDDEEPRAARE